MCKKNGLKTTVRMFHARSNRRRLRRPHGGRPPIVNNKNTRKKVRNKFIYTLVRKSAAVYSISSNSFPSLVFLIPFYIYFFFIYTIRGSLPPPAYIFLVFFIIYYMCTIIHTLLCPSYLPLSNYNAPSGSDTKKALL